MATSSFVGDKVAMDVSVAAAEGQGAPDAEAYDDDTGAEEGTVISLLKGIYVQNAAIIALLTAIETNTQA